MCQGIVLRDEHSEVGQLRAIGIVIGIGNKKKKFRFALVVRTVAFITIVKQSLLMASLHFNKRKFLESGLRGLKGLKVMMVGKQS